MSFLLDNSVAMCWLLADGKPADVAYAETVLDALRERQAQSHRSGLWRLAMSSPGVRGQRATHRGPFPSVHRPPGAAEHRDGTATAAHALGDTLHLARRYKLSAYDAAYLELALRTGSPLATLDADLKKAARAAGVQPFAPN